MWRCQGRGQPMTTADDWRPTLEWTGERYVPQVSGNIRLEHLHRYLLARELSKGQRVLDIASGEGRLGPARRGRRVRRWCGYPTRGRAARTGPLPSTEPGLCSGRLRRHPACQPVDRCRGFIRDPRTSRPTCRHDAGGQARPAAGRTPDHLQSRSARVFRNP